MATDEGFASSSALALVLGSRRDGEAEKGGRLAELLGEEERIGEGGRRKECGRGLLCGGLVGFNNSRRASQVGLVGRKAVEMGRKNGPCGVSIH